MLLRLTLQCTSNSVLSIESFEIESIEIEMTMSRDMALFGKLVFALSVVSLVCLDGKTSASDDDTAVFLKQWQQACASPGNQIISVPAGKTLTLSPITLSGPCKASNIHIQVMGRIEAPAKKADWGGETGSWIKFTNVDGLTITGPGQIDGKGAAWWGCKNEPNHCKDVPNGLAMYNCRHVEMSNLNIKDSPNIHVGVVDSHDVHISNVKITAPELSPNTDGIHLERSNTVRVEHSNIGTGDDCISIGSGTHNVNITEIACGPGHGISVGSLGQGNSKAEVSNIRVTNCNFTGTQNAARIKTWQGGTGYARDISFERLTFNAVEYAIILDQFYCNGGRNCVNADSAVKISNIKFIHAHGTSTYKEPIALKCSGTASCTDIIMEDVHILPAEEGKKVSSTCTNAHGKARDVAPSVPCLTLIKSADEVQVIKKPSSSDEEKDSDFLAEL